MLTKRKSALARAARTNGARRARDARASGGGLEAASMTLRNTRGNSAAWRAAAAVRDHPLDESRAGRRAQSPRSARRCADSCARVQFTDQRAARTPATARGEVA
jgi:hypothetical protein